jgi:hypothetical protein
MAVILQASIYSYQANPTFTDQYGLTMGFPTANIVIKPLNPTFFVHNIYCQSTIQIVTGNPPFPTYYAYEDATTLITNANT